MNSSSRKLTPTTSDGYRCFMAVYRYRIVHLMENARRTITRMKAPDYVLRMHNSAGTLCDNKSSEMAPACYQACADLSSCRKTENEYDDRSTTQARWKQFDIPPANPLLSPSTLPLPSISLLFFSPFPSSPLPLPPSSP